jgi:hypothetical protein
MTRARVQDIAPGSVILKWLYCGTEVSGLWMCKTSRCNISDYETATYEYMPYVVLDIVRRTAEGSAVKVFSSESQRIGHIYLYTDCLLEVL